MAEFAWLRRYDKLPAVAVAQMLLNRTGASLTVDGDFGPATKAAVVNFQSGHRLTPDGVIGQNTWPRLVHQERLPICDCIDVFDPDLYTSENRFLTGVGGRPITIGGMSNGMEQIVSDIVSRHSNLFLLRFHGHGAAGLAGVSFGHGDHRSRSSFQNDQATRQVLRRLRSAMGPYGCIQFMHCQTGRGPAGRQFLQMVANETNVPVTAAIDDQYASTLRETVRYEGRTTTFCPGLASIGGWASTRPAFVGMSFA
jgi:hypothetical protein